MGEKRGAATAGITANDDLLTITPLGAGQEVGRSCHIVTFKNKTIMVCVRALGRACKALLCLSL